MDAQARLAKASRLPVLIKIIELVIAVYPIAIENHTLADLDASEYHVTTLHSRAVCAVAGRRHAHAAAVGFNVNRMSTSRLTKRHSSLSLKPISMSSNASSSLGENSNHVRKSNGSLRSRQW